MTCFLNNAGTTMCLFLLSFVASTSGLRKFAVARPFSSGDAPLLAESFDVWSTFPPCREGAGDDPPDLYLVFSQSFENNQVATNATQDVERIFDDTEGWGGCFGQIYTLATEIPPEKDIYKKNEINTNVMWVNGPNRQFERTVRSLQDAGVELFYLMEMDSVPTKPYWLDTLVEDVQNQETEFAILGSKYRGDNWDKFYSLLPSSLVNHINGNAIYNLTSPLLGMIVEQLEAEALSVENSAAFDYRISQILEQAKYGTKPSFSSYLTENFPSTNLSDAIKNNASQLKAAVRETFAIGNYASTNIVPSYLDSREVIIHGAKMRTAWDKEVMGNITLVVSDWHDGNARFLLSALDESEHPFDGVTVMTPDDTEFPDLKNLSVLPIQFIARQNRSNLDLCTAPVTTEWFMMTNSFHRIRQDFQLMTEYDQGSLKPVVPFVKATPDSCYSFPSCSKKLEMAKQILPSTDTFYQDNQFIFHSSTRDEFCTQYEDMFSTILPPSASSYISFLESLKPEEESLYVAFDKGAGGSRDFFLRLPQSMLPSNTTWYDNSTNSTSSTNSTNFTEPCTLYTSSEQCERAYCEWRNTFSSCRHAYSLGSPSVTTQVKQVGQSGAFKISNGQANDTNSITVEIAALDEVSADGTRTRGVCAFQNQDFQVSGPKAASIEGVPAYKVTLHTVLQTQGSDVLSFGSILLDVYVLQDKGTIGTDLERWEVSANDVKFNIVLQDWMPQPLSDFIDVSVLIKGKDGKRLESQNGRWQLGTIPVSLSSRVQLDGSYEDMPAGYPKVTESIYKFRFPRFQNNVTYDPVVGYSGNELLCQGCVVPDDGSVTPTYAGSSSPSFNPTLEPSSSPSSKPSIQSSFPPSDFPSEIPSASDTPSQEPTNKGNRLAPTMNTAPTTSTSPSTRAPVVLQTNQASRSDNKSTQDRPAWVNYITGGILAVGAALFIIMIVKSFPVAPPDGIARGMRQRESASLNVQSGRLVEEEMNSLGSVEEFSSIESVDLYETYLSEAGHFREVETGIEVAK